MNEQRIDLWLVHDFRHSNPTLARLLPGKDGGKRHLTRRVALAIPASGACELVTSFIDASAFGDVAGAGKAIKHSTFIGWEEYRKHLARIVSGKRVAMEYAPGCSLPVASVVDAGTVELVRALGGEVVSSADLAQVAVSQWGASAVKNHERASAITGRIMPGAFAQIASAHRAGKLIQEHEVAQWVRDEFAKEGLEWPDGPIVAVNEHAADPHYEPSEKRPCAIKPGDWVLIDMWARVKGEMNIYSDITWTGYCGKEIPARHAKVFDTVKRARDASLALAQERWREGASVQGWELDDAARQLIELAGFGAGIRHRTGHSLSSGTMVHGSGMNLDNLETHDTRQMLAGTGFTIEPGIYLPDERIGVRNEINVYVDAERGPIVTSCVNDAPVIIA